MSYEGDICGVLRSPTYDDDSLSSHPRYRDGHCGCADYYGGFVDGYRAAEHDLAQREQAVSGRERIVSQLERDTKLYMTEQEERHRRTLEVMDAEVARLTALVAAAEEEEERRKWSSKWADE